MQYKVAYRNVKLL